MKKTILRVFTFSLILLSNSLAQPLNGEELKFAEPIYIYEVTAVRSVAIIDLNKDNRNDIALGVLAANLSDEKRLRVYYQNEQGEINHQPEFYELLNWAADMDVVDLDGDGYNELIIANQDTNGIIIYYADSLKELKYKSVNKGVEGTASTAIGDFNNDGLIDIASAKYYGPPDSFFVYYQQPDGSFDSVKSFYLDKTIILESWINIQAADMNGDSLTDVIVLGGEIEKYISIYLQQPDGELKLNQYFSTDLGWINFAVADFTGDGRGDIVVTGIYPTITDWSIYLYIPDSTGKVPDIPVYYPAYDYPISFITEDIDLDGRTDLIAHHYQRAPFTIFRQRPEGGFYDYVSFAASNVDASFQASVDVGDINSDGKPDVIATSGLGDMKLILNETERLTAISDEEVLTEKNYILYQNYPNPFNPTTNISFSIPQSGNVEIKLYDLLGNLVAELLNEYKNVGTYTLTFNSDKHLKKSLSSGIYFYSMRSENFSQTKKLMLLK